MDKGNVACKKKEIAANSDCKEILVNIFDSFSIVPVRADFPQSIVVCAEKPQHPEIKEKGIGILNGSHILRTQHTIDVRGYDDRHKHIEHIQCAFGYYVVKKGMRSHFMELRSKFWYRPIQDADIVACIFINVYCGKCS